MQYQKKNIEHPGTQAASNSKTNAIQLQDNRATASSQKKQVEALVNKNAKTPIQKKNNSTGLPDHLKSGIENLSGHNLDDVKVHYNSDKPAHLNAHAYTQGNDIHIAPGQEKHLPHEAWHVVQQKQGRVKPTVQRKGKINVNNNKALEKEADVMGQKTLQAKNYDSQKQLNFASHSISTTAQLAEDTSVASITTDIAWGLIKGVLQKEKDNVKWTAIISPILKSGDTLIVTQVSSWTGLSTLVPVINYIIIACKAALAIWDSIPDTIKTGILYVMGVLTAKAPVLSRYDSLQDLIVKGDEGDVREKVQNWLDKATTAITYFTQPLSSLYRYITGSSEKTAVPETKDTKDSEPGKAEMGSLINLNLHVITLMVNTLKLGYYPNKPKEENETKKQDKTTNTKQKPGLIVDFFVQMHLFGHNIPDRGDADMDRLFFPFSGEFTFTAGSSIVIIKGEKDLGIGIILGNVNIHPLEVTKSGVKKAGLKIGKLQIGSGVVILTDAEGMIDNKLITLKTNAELNIAGHKITGKIDFKMNDGKFESIMAADIAYEQYKIVKLGIDKSYNGEAEIEIGELSLLKNTLSATGINASAKIEKKKLKNLGLTLQKLNLNFWNSAVNINGAHLSYTGADPEKDIQKDISGGAEEINANINGAHINLQNLIFNTENNIFKFSGGSLKFNDFEIKIEEASLQNGAISITKATLSLPHYGIEGSVNNFQWNSKGFSLESVTIAFPGKTFSPIEQVLLSNMSASISKGGGYKLTLTSDVDISPNGKKLVGAKAAQLTVSKEGISGKLAELNIDTSIFSLKIENAEFNNERIGAGVADISFKSTKEENGYAKMLPSFDTGLLDFINPTISLKAKDVYFNKGKGFSIGSVESNLKELKINLFGVEAIVNPIERFIAIKSSFTFPGNIPSIWPFSLSVPFPIFIGVAGHFGIDLGGGVTLHLDAKAQREKGKNKPYMFKANPGISGDLNLKINAGVELGLRLAVALQANLYAQALLHINSTADLTGGLQFADSKMTQSHPLIMLYELKSAVTAEVGGEIKVKAFMFYDKQLTKIKFKDWKLGEWSKSGKFLDSEGKRTEDEQKGKFLNDVSGPTLTSEILEGEEAKKLLLSANERIIGSGAKRKELITELTKDVSILASQLLKKQQKLKQEFDENMNDLMKIIIKKDLFYRKHFEQEGISAKLTVFDTKNKLDEKKDKIRNAGAILDNYEAELSKILKLMNNVEAGLDIVGLEDGTGNNTGQINNTKNEALHIEGKIDELSPVNIPHEKLNSELDKMGAEALTVDISSSIMTLEKFVEISTTKGTFGGETDRKRVMIIDNELQAYNNVRNASKAEQIPILESLKQKLDTYIAYKFSSRTQAALLLKFQVEQALSKLKRKDTI